MVLEHMKFIPIYFVKNAFNVNELNLLCNALSQMTINNFIYNLANIYRNE